ALFRPRSIGPRQRTTPARWIARSSSISRAATSSVFARSTTIEAHVACGSDRRDARDQAPKPKQPAEGAGCEDDCGLARFRPELVVDLDFDGDCDGDLKACRWVDHAR